MPRIRRHGRAVPARILVPDGLLHDLRDPRRHLRRQDGPRSGDHRDWGHLELVAGRSVEGSPYGASSGGGRGVKIFTTGARMRCFQNKET